MTLISPNLFQIREWLDDYDTDQCQWIDDFLTNRKRLRKIPPNNMTPAAVGFDPILYNWPQGDELSALMDEIKDNWLLHKELDWITKWDNIQARTLHEFLEKRDLVKTEFKDQEISYSFKNHVYNWPIGNERSRLIRAMKTHWRSSGLKRDWIKNYDPVQLKWIDDFMVRMGLKFNLSVEPRLPFNPNLYNWKTTTPETIDLIKTIKRAWHFEQKFSWIDRNNKAQCRWVNEYLLQNKIENHRQIDFSLFDTANYNLRSISNDVIAKMKDDWLVEKDSQWINPNDAEQQNWVKEYLHNNKILLDPFKAPARHVELNQYQLPEDIINKRQFIKIMHNEWIATGLGFDWLKLENPNECQKANEYLSERLKVYNLYPSDPHTLFDPGLYELPTGDNRKSFIKRMQKTWEQRTRRATSTKKSLSYQLSDVTHHELKSLAKILGKKSSQTLEYIIHEGLKYEKSAKKRYQDKLDEIKIEKDLNNPKLRTLSPTEQTITKLQKDIALIEKMYTGLLLFSDMTLKQLADAKQIISSNDLNEVALNKEQLAFSEKYYKQHKSKYLKPFPGKEKIAETNPPEENTSTSDEDISP